MKCLAFALGIILLKFTHMIAQLLDHSHLLVCSIPLYLETSSIVIKRLSRLYAGEQPLFQSGMRPEPSNVTSPLLGYSYETNIERRNLVLPEHTSLFTSDRSPFSNTY